MICSCLIRQLPCTLHTPRVQCTLHTSHSNPLYSVQCTVHCTPITAKHIPCTDSVLQSTLQCTVHSPITAQHNSCTLLTAPYTVHCTLQCHCTLQFTIQCKGNVHNVLQSNVHHAVQGQPGQLRGQSRLLLPAATGTSFGFSKF